MRRKGFVRRYRIAIVSVENDLHALAIHKALAQQADAECRIIESNRVCGSATVNWSNGKKDLECTILAKGGEEIAVHDLDIIWWRRVGLRQEIPSNVTDPVHIDVINNECAVALLGILLSEFRGTWINHPLHTQVAQNKLVQLRAAESAGFRVPHTLVSQDVTAIRRFCERLDYKVVVKPLIGTQRAPLFTTMATPDHLACEDSVALCPAMYQEFIPGVRHIRAQCFGDAVYSVVIESEDLDWRADLDVPFTVFDLAEDVKARLQKVLKLLQLKMGIVDLKFAQDGAPVWFEINPQGQFLFVEGLSGLDLTSAFADFLYREARQASKSAPMEMRGLF